MSLSLSAATLPVLVNMLRNLDHFLQKAQASAAARKFEPAVLASARLSPDMLPFTAQITIACDAAKNGVARMAGIEAPKFEDNETTLDQLRERIAKTLAFLGGVQAQALDGREASDVTFPVRGGTRTMRADDYLRHWMLPNFFFHVTMAYAILRHNGVELGKADYLAGAKAA